MNIKTSGHTASAAIAPTLLGVSHADQVTVAAEKLMLHLLCGPNARGVTTILAPGASHVTNVLRADIPISEAQLNKLSDDVMPVIMPSTSRYAIMLDVYEQAIGTPLVHSYHLAARLNRPHCEIMRYMRRASNRRSVQCNKDSPLFYPGRYITDGGRTFPCYLVTSAGLRAMFVDSKNTSSAQRRYFLETMRMGEASKKVRAHWLAQRTQQYPIPAPSPAACGVPASAPKRAPVALPPSAPIPAPAPTRPQAGSTSEQLLLDLIETQPTLAINALSRVLAGRGYGDESNPSKLEAIGLMVRNIPGLPDVIRPDAVAESLHEELLQHLAESATRFDRAAQSNKLDMSFAVASLGSNTFVAPSPKVYKASYLESLGWHTRTHVYTTWTSWFIDPETNKPVSVDTFQAVARHAFLHPGVSSVVTPVKVEHARQLRAYACHVFTENKARVSLRISHRGVSYLRDNWASLLKSTKDLRAEDDVLYESGA